MSNAGAERLVLAQARRLASAGRCYEALRLLTAGDGSAAPTGVMDGGRPGGAEGAGPGGRREGVAAWVAALERLEREASLDRAGAATCRRILGDAHVLLLRLDEAVALYEAAGDTDGLRRVLRLALDLGRYRVVDRLGALLPDDVPRGDALRRFLLERALPGVRVGGDARAGFWVDQAAIADVAARLGEPVPALLARTARAMHAAGSRAAVKLHVFAQLSGDAALAAQLERPFQARADEPRAALGGRVADLVASRGGRVLATLQRGDGDDWDPKSAGVWLAEEGGRRVVWKEHLRLPLDYSRVDSGSEEREVLEAVSHDHPGVAPLLDVVALGRHEVLALGFAPGEDVGRRLARQGALPARDALRVVRDVAGVVAHLHARGVAWLDVKPRNAIDDGGRAVAIDFGMARRLAGAREVKTLPSTAAYVPPELARTFAGGPASDVFQLGLFLAEALTGRHAFARVPVPQADELTREDELLGFTLATLWTDPDLEALPAAAREVCAAALARDPARRPSASEVEGALARALA